MITEGVDCKQFPSARGFTWVPDSSTVRQMAVTMKIGHS